MRLGELHAQMWSIVNKLLYIQSFFKARPKALLGGEKTPTEDFTFLF